MKLRQVDIVIVFEAPRMVRLPSGCKSRYRNLHRMAKANLVMSIKTVQAASGPVQRETCHAAALCTLSLHLPKPGRGKTASSTRASRDAVSQCRSGAARDSLHVLTSFSALSR